MLEFLMLRGARAPLVQTANTVFSLTGRTNTPASTWAANTLSTVKPSDTFIFNGLAHGFYTPAGGSCSYDIVLNGGSGSGGNGDGISGNLYKLTLSGVIIPANTLVIAIAGSTGYRVGSSATDGTGGGGGGASWIAYESSGGNWIFGGKTFTILAQACGSSGGNDVAYKPTFPTPEQPDYTSVVSTLTSCVVDNGITFTRSTSTAYGGWPNGKGVDDLWAYGGGAPNNHVKAGTTYVLDYVSNSATRLAAPTLTGVVSFKGPFR